MISIANKVPRLGPHSPDKCQPPVKRSRAPWGRTGHAWRRAEAGRDEGRARPSLCRAGSGGRKERGTGRSFQGSSDSELQCVRAVKAGRTSSPHTNGDALCTQRVRYLVHSRCSFLGGVAVIACTRSPRPPWTSVPPVDPGPDAHLQSNMAPIQHERGPRAEAWESRSFCKDKRYFQKPHSVPF